MGGCGAQKGSGKAARGSGGKGGGKGGAAVPRKGTGNFLGNVKVSNIAKFAKQTVANTAELTKIAKGQLQQQQATARLE